MKNVVLTFLLFLGYFLANAQIDNIAENQETIAIINATIVDVETGNLQLNRTILIENDQIKVFKHTYFGPLSFSLSPEHELTSHILSNPLKLFLKINTIWEYVWTVS